MRDYWLQIKGSFVIDVRNVVSKNIRNKFRSGLHLTTTRNF